LADDSSGNFSLPVGYTATTGETIQASQHNPPLEAIAAALSARLSRSGVAPMTGPLRLADGTVSAPSLTFATGTDTGLYKTSTGLAVTVNGTKVAEFGAGGLIVGGTPIGAGMDYWGTTAPAGWLFPYGQAVSRTTYAALFDKLGTTYGEGDGSTTFNLPDKRDRTSFAKGDMGGTAANRLQATTTISTTDNSTSATVASATGLAIGMFITSTNVPSGTTLTAISGTTVTMSADATATASGTAAVFTVLSGSALGDTGGDATGALSVAQMPAHDHDGATGSTQPRMQTSGSAFALNLPATNNTAQNGGNAYVQLNGIAGTDFITIETHTHTIASQGGGGRFNKLPPGIVCNYIIFAGA